jgi:hypothetical protein
MRVCWQVTGTRKDPWAAANPFEVEEEKSPEDRGRYLQPDLYDALEEQRVRMVPMVGPMEEERLRQMIRQEAPQAPQMPPGIETRGFGESPQPPASRRALNLRNHHRCHREHRRCRQASPHRALAAWKKSTGGR